MKTRWHIQAIAFLIALVSLVNCGCQESDSAVAIERNSSKTPLFKSDLDAKQSEVNSKIPASGKKLDFVHADHFGLIAFDVQSVTSSKTLDKVQWPQLSEMLTKTAGTGELDSIEKIWLLLDRENFSLMPTGDSFQNPMVIVVDELEDINLQKTALRLQKTLPPNLASKEIELEIGKLTKISQSKSVYIATTRRMMIGSHDAISKLVDNPKPNQLLVDKFYQLDETYFSGVVDATAIRSQFQLIFGMIGSFGPMKDYAKLPEALKQIDFQVDLDSKDMMSMNLEIADKPLAQLIANSIQSSGGDSGAGMGGFPGMGGMFGGGGMPGGAPPRPMFEPASLESMLTISEEIEEQQLLSVRLKDDFIRLKLARPNSLDEFVGAMLEDQLKSASLNTRLLQAKEIAAALKAYEKKFDHLPPAGLVTPKDADENTRAQFNWLTGILPELNQQDLYDQFDFSSPFDSDENLELAKRMPAAFGTSEEATEQNKEAGRTRFRGLGGLGIWGDGSTVPTLKQVKDRQFSTAVVGEVSQAELWTAPETGILNVERVNDLELGQPDELGWIVITANFKLRAVAKDRNDAVSAIITPAGGEDLPSSNFIQLELPQEPE